MCTIGGNVANNSGGPHCLAYGVTNAHVLAVEVVLSSGEAVLLGGLEGETPGYDLRGAFVGSEGMFGIATKIAVRLTPNPESIKTLLLSFDSVADAAATVGEVIASGLVPAAIEMMDKRCVAAVEDFVHAGYPREAEAVLLIEVDGMERGVAKDTEKVTEIGRAHNGNVRVAADEAERALLWKGRKSAFGRLPGSRPTTTSTTRWCLVPSLSRCLKRFMRSLIVAISWFLTFSTPVTATCIRSWPMTRASRARMSR